MWWYVAQKPDTHKTNKRIGRDHQEWYGLTHWEYDYRHSMNHDPRRGIGEVIFVEAHHCRQAQNRLQEIGLKRKSQRYGKVREAPFLPFHAFKQTARSTYMHFLNGWFFPIHGLETKIIEDLIQFYGEK